MNILPTIMLLNTLRLAAQIYLHADYLRSNKTLIITFYDDCKNTFNLNKKNMSGKTHY